MNEIKKEVLKGINKKYKERELQKFEQARMNLERSKVISKFSHLKDDFLRLNSLQKFCTIKELVYKSSFFNDDEIMQLIKSMGLLKYTPKTFINYNEFFNALDEHQEQTKYLFLYEIIWVFYKSYSSSVIIEKMALDLKIDLSEVGRKVNRQIDNLNFPLVLKELINQVQELPDVIKEEFPNYKMNISDKNPVNSIFHTIKYAHKNDLHNLYKFLVDFNLKAEFIDFYEPDFKCEFYDLLKIVLRNKAQLNDSVKAKNNYHNERQFKIKQVNSLILS